MKPKNQRKEYRPIPEEVNRQFDRQYNLKPPDQEICRHKSCKKDAKWYRDGKWMCEEHFEQWMRP